MFEKFTSVDANDFRARYQGTYGFFRRGDFRQLAKLTTIDGVVKFIDKDGIDYTLNPDSPNDVGFEFLPPKAGWHNTSTGAWLVTRIAARQWLRGICSRNTSIGTPFGHKAVVDFPILAQIYDKVTKSEAALKDFNEDTTTKGKTHCFALSEQFAITNFNGNKQLFCLDSVIGTCEKKVDHFAVALDDTNLWRQEIKDVFNRNKFKVEIQ